MSCGTKWNGVHYLLCIILITVRYHSGGHTAREMDRNTADTEDCWGKQSIAPQNADHSQGWSSLCHGSLWQKGSLLEAAEWLLWKFHFTLCLKEGYNRGGSNENVSGTRGPCHRRGAVPWYALISISHSACRRTLRILRISQNHCSPPIPHSPDQKCESQQKNTSDPMSSMRFLVSNVFLSKTKQTHRNH